MFTVVEGPPLLPSFASFSPVSSPFYYCHSPTSPLTVLRDPGVWSLAGEGVAGAPRIWGRGVSFVRVSSWQAGGRALTMKTLLCEVGTGGVPGGAIAGKEGSWTLDLNTWCLGSTFPVLQQGSRFHFFEPQFSFFLSPSHLLLSLSLPLIVVTYTQHYF